MKQVGLWIPRKSRPPRVHQPRPRRACTGELIQIDGCEHRWFEDRGPVCTLLVYVDDATSRVMQLLFVSSESTFTYFEATRAISSVTVSPWLSTAIRPVSSGSTTSRQHLHLNLCPVVQRLHQQNGLLFTYRQPLGCRAAAYLLLDGIQLSDSLQRFGCDVGRCAGMHVVEFPPGMRLQYCVFRSERSRIGIEVRSAGNLTFFTAF